jgi:TRAP-type C4-dicarboxylate transport system substrate-binding protein
LRLAIPVAFVAFCAAAHAEPRTLRIASVIPEGTSWARELRAMAGEVEAATVGQLKLKLYLGGVAGDELDELPRLRKNQLDGVVSAGILCQELAPTFRVLRVPGVFQSSDESEYVLGQLRPVLDQELLAAGFVQLTNAAVGPSIIFSRTPIGSMKELRQHPLWVWDADSTLRSYLQAMGLKLGPVPIYGAASAYNQHKIDGFITAPTAALAFQWSAIASYFSNLHLSYVTGCFLVTSRAFDALPVEQREVLRTAIAKMQKRIQGQGHDMDRALIGGLFAKQGLKEVRVTPLFQAEFFDAAIDARRRLAGKLVDQKLLERVLALLADFRAHP